MNVEQTLYWPKGLPRTLDVPKTSLFYNLEVAATRYPDKPVIVFYDSVIRYSELLDQVLAMAGYLQQECGVKRHRALHSEKLNEMSHITRL